MSSVRCSVSYVSCDVFLFHVGDVLVFPKGLTSLSQCQQSELRGMRREALKANKTQVPTAYDVPTACCVGPHT
jgi:hypothetical protein